MTTDEQIDALVKNIETMAEAYATDENGDFDLDKYLAFKEGVNVGFQIWALALTDKPTN